MKRKEAHYVAVEAKRYKYYISRAYMIDLGVNKHVETRRVMDREKERERKGTERKRESVRYSKSYLTDRTYFK